MKIGIFFNKKRKPKTEKPAKEIAKWLREKGYKSYLNPNKESLLSSINFGVIIGGDGTVLGVANKVAGYGIPIVGINFGHVGWLCAINGDDANTVKEKLEQILLMSLSNENNIEIRTRIKAVVSNDGKEVLQVDGLNEIVIGGIPKTVFLEVEIIDGYDRYKAWVMGDGAMACTKTGSTAYWKKAGGPVFTSDSLGILANNATFENPGDMTSVESGEYKTLPENNQPFVGSTRSEYRIKIINEYKDNIPFLIGDGQTIYRLHKGDTIVINKSENVNKFIRVK